MLPQTKDQLVGLVNEVDAGRPPNWYAQTEILVEQCGMRMSLIRESGAAQFLWVSDHKAYDSEAHDYLLTTPESFGISLVPLHAFFTPSPFTGVFDEELSEQYPIYSYGLNVDEISPAWCQSLALQFHKSADGVRTPFALMTTPAMSEYALIEIMRHLLRKMPRAKPVIDEVGLPQEKIDLE